MFFRTIFVCLFGFVLVKSAEQNSLEITFKITSTTVKKGNEIICDHNFTNVQENTYTVLEGENFTIFTKHITFINYFYCRDNEEKQIYSLVKNSKNVTTFKAEKRMGTTWNCTVLAHRDIAGMIPEEKYKNHTYSAAHCYMKIHVRQTKSPQTILVNTMELQANRTNLSEKNFDFIAEYQYADGDVVDVTCANFLNPANLMMEYEMAGTKSDNSTMRDLSSTKAIGFVATLHSGHNNSYMICTNTEATDYTKVMVRFVRKEFKNIVSIKINGMTLRPKLNVAENNNYQIDYKYLRGQLIDVVCEVLRTDIKLVVMDENHFFGKVSSHKKKVLDPNKKTEMSFYLNSTDTKKLMCWSDNKTSGVSAEQVTIDFTAGNFSIDPYPLHMELPSNGTVMELYNDEKLKVIYYDFEDGEKLQLKCGPLVLPQPGPVLYLQFEDSDIHCNNKSCNISKTLDLPSDGKKIVCYLKEDNGPREEDEVKKEIRVILRKRVITTTTTTTTTTTSTTFPTAETSNTTNRYGAQPVSGETGNDENLPIQTWAVIGGGALCIIVICVSIVIVKLRKRNHSQGGTHNRSYENLQNSTETSIPAYPPQWESNYAVPADRRAEDTTYSVPCQEPALYSTPTPKNLRNKKQKPVDPTYAVLEVPKAQGQKNAFKETDDPNYSEVYANRQEQCYAKVLPKSARNKLVQDNNPYSYVTNEPAYANTAEPEPMYCEPAKAQVGTYANLNNAHYVNSHAHEYVEPTYCEPQKRMK